ncbi:MAG: type VII secretion-associated serine protease mycosin [Corynebacteriales bacterium]|nr:type VII secretion-associated serine protease mycosin [Mycobacteriales bacterium]
MTIGPAGRLARLVLVAAIGVGAPLVAVAPAQALPGIARELPPVITGPIPREGPVAPLVATKQTAVCATEIATRGDFVSPPAGLVSLDIAKAWEFSKGAGQKIAVIDTGVFRHPRLSVIPGGDYVSTGDGTRDCDGHGTIVAGIAAGKQSSGDGFAGVAPDAQVIAIRQTSESYAPADAREAGSDTPINATGYGNVTTLARAVIRAVNLGADVINISETACFPVNVPMRDQSLGAAVKYAFSRNVVVVAAAGNLSTQDQNCTTQNPGANGARLANPWASVLTQSSPAYFSPYVVSVASVDPDGRPSNFSLAGPWVTVAAPGTDQVSLNISTNPPVIDAIQLQGKSQPINGTSYAAPYVAGLAALIKARFPQLTAAQVIDRITRTAHHPSDGRDNAVGYGLIDPVTALTTTTPDTTVAGADVADPRTGDTRNIYAAEKITPPAAAPAPDHTPRTIAIGVSLLALALAVASWALMRNRNGDRRRLREGTDY